MTLKQVLKLLVEQEQEARWERLQLGPKLVANTLFSAQAILAGSVVQMMMVLDLVLNLLPSDGLARRAC